MTLELARIGAPILALLLSLTGCTACPCAEPNGVILLCDERGVTRTEVRPGLIVLYDEEGNTSVSLASGEEGALMIYGPPPPGHSPWHATGRVPFVDLRVTEQASELRLVSGHSEVHTRAERVGGAELRLVAQDGFDGSPSALTASVSSATAPSLSQVHEGVTTTRTLSPN